ncbi:hypothetical protein B5F33_05135 [Collinsella sp. An2]|nr:hypothetical protein B5F33_05135 [Collinsella sp. An2]
MIGHECTPWVITALQCRLFPLCLLPPDRHQTIPSVGKSLAERMAACARRRKDPLAAQLDAVVGVRASGVTVSAATAADAVSAIAGVITAATTADAATTAAAVATANTTASATAW